MKQPQDEFVRKRKERQKKIRKRRLIISFFVFLIIAVLVSITLSLTVFFPIKNISISGSKVYDAELIEKESGIEIGDNLFSTSQKSTEKLLKSRLPYIDSITFERKLPGSLNIKVKDASEYACYLVKGKYYTVSKEGWVLNSSAKASENIFVIKGCKAVCKVGNQIEYPDEETSLLVEEMISVLNIEEIKINSIDITDKFALQLKVEDRFTVELGTSSNLSEKIKHLNAMIDEIPPEEKGKINLSMWSTANTKGTFVKETAEN